MWVNIMSIENFEQLQKELQIKESLDETLSHLTQALKTRGFSDGVVEKYAKNFIKEKESVENRINSFYKENFPEINNVEDLSLWVESVYYLTDWSQEELGKVIDKSQAQASRIIKDGFTSLSLEQIQNILKEVGIADLVKITIK